MVLQKTPVCIFIELARILRILHSKLAETPLFAGKERDEKAARSLSEGILKKKRLQQAVVHKCIQPAGVLCCSRMVAFYNAQAVALYVRALLKKNRLVRTFLQKTLAVR